ncbi:MAG: hypothetical protein U1F43_29265 [Myxococcota bacterium]
MTRALTRALDELYLADVSDAEWRARVVASLAPLADDQGIALMSFGRAGQAITHCEVFGTAPPDYQRWLEAAIWRLPEHQFGVAFDLAQSGRTMSRILSPADYEAYRRGIASFGLDDLLATFGIIDRDEILGAYVPPARSGAASRARARATCACAASTWAPPSARAAAARRATRPGSTPAGGCSTPSARRSPRATRCASS